MRSGEAVTSNQLAEVVQAHTLVLVSGIVRPHPGLLPEEKENRFQSPSRVEPSIARVRFPDQISSWPKTAFVCQEKVSYVSIF